MATFPTRTNDAFHDILHAEHDSMAADLTAARDYVALLEVDDLYQDHAVEHDTQRDDAGEADAGEVDIKEEPGEVDARENNTPKDINDEEDDHEPHADVVTISRKARCGCGDQYKLTTCPASIWKWPLPIDTVRDIQSLSGLDRESVSGSVGSSQSQAYGKSVISDIQIDTFFSRALNIEQAVKLLISEKLDNKYRLCLFIDDLTSINALAPRIKAILPTTGTWRRPCYSGPRNST